MRFITVCLLLLVSQYNEAGTTAVVTVGSDVACDYSSITAASFNEPSSDLLDIKLAKNFNLSSLQLLDNRPTNIRGGFATCAATDSSGRTLLDGDGFNGAIFVAVASENTTMYNTLQLFDLEITGGNSNTSGGVISLTGSWRMRLFNVYMHNNVSNQDGGAIFITPSSDVNVFIPQVSILDNSIISSNTADNGGAIACDGLGQIFAWNMQMANNNVNGSGGAVFVNNGCEYYQYGGGLFQGVIFNNADEFGGGIAAFNDSTVWVQSNLGLGQAFVAGNSASSGGGIFVASGATVTASDAVINNNSATLSGGGIRSTVGHVVIQRVAPGAQCHDEVRCSTVSNNFVSGTDASFAGGGAIATFGGTLELRGTYLENNSAFYGSAIRARFMPLNVDLTTQLTLVGNVIAGNSNAPQVVYLDESSADIAFSTFVDNEDMSRVIEMAYPTTSADGNEVTVSGSVFEHPGSTLPSVELTTAGQLPVGDCNRNESSSTGDLIGQPRSDTVAVLFEDQPGGDYRLQDNSYYVDWCTGSFLGIASNYSANGLPRPIDNSLANLYGTYDLGGLERYQLDLIFEDGFE